jgi:hypothetical protein
MTMLGQFKAKCPNWPSIEWNKAGGSDKGIARNIVDLELPRIDVAQDQVRLAGAADWGDACKLPIQSHVPRKAEPVS